jgi:ATP-dependent DNA helicase UvrD/PcrA
MTFNPTREQRSIIDFPAEPLRVAAGAGTGKTTTIVERLARHVGEGFDPARALGITFTNKAADELRQRLRDVLGARADGREVEVATYHSFAASLLDEFGARIGYVGGAILMDEGHRTELAIRVLRDLTDTTLDLTALQQRRDEVLTVADALNENLRDAAEILAIAPADPDEIWERRIALAHAAGAYAEAKERLGLIEYSDLIRLAVRILSEHPAVATEVGGRYDIVLLDEYQDTDPAQRILLTTLFGSGTSVTAVGDTDQTIYEWRGASIENFEHFPVDFRASDGTPADTLALSINRRSDRAIIDVANLVRGQLPTIEGSAPLSPRPEVADGDVTTAWFRTDTDEAAWIGAEMVARHEAGIPYADMAVLCRTREAIRVIAAALRDTGVPYSVSSMGELLRVPEIADLMAWLAVLSDPSNDAAALRILLGGKYRLGLADVAALRRHAKRSKAPGLIDGLITGGETPELSPDAADAVGRFVGTFRGLFQRSQARSVTGIIDDLVETLDYWAEVAALPSARSVTVRLNLNRFIDLAGQWRAIDGRPTLSGFLRYLAALDESGRAEALDTVDEPTEDAVMLITAHGAKGLEWDDVYIPSIAAKVFPGSVRLYHDPLRTPLVLPFELRLDREAVAAIRDEPDEDARKALLAERHAHQEWRLAYVAVTRARRRLVMSGHAWDGDLKKPREPGPLLELVRRLPAATVGPTITDPGERPPMATFTAPVEPPDPLFRSGWSAAVRSARQDPTWIASEYPELIDAVEDQAGQLALLLADLHVPRAEPDLAFATSVTNLVALAECPLKFRWIHHDRLPRRPRASARRGTEFHRRVELHNLGIASLDAIDDGTDAFDDSRWDQQEEPNVDPWGAFAASRFHESTPILAETPFEITFGGRALRGKVDAVYEDGGDWEIVDYKSGKASPSDARRVQLQAYAVAATDGALAMQPGGDLVVTFAYFGTNPVVEVSEAVDDQWITDARDTIGGLLERAESGPFPPAPSDACRWCDFLHHCETGRSHLGL